MRKPPTGRAALARALRTAALALALVGTYAAGVAKGGTEPRPPAAAASHTGAVAASRRSSPNGHEVGRSAEDRAARTPRWIPRPREA